MKWFLMALLQRVLILFVLVFLSFSLPVATFWLVRDPLGAQFVFWVSPWVVAFWSVIAYILVGSRFWRGKPSVEDWKFRHGSYLWRAAKNTVMDVHCARVFLRRRACRRLSCATVRDRNAHLPARGVLAIGVHDPVERNPWVS